MLDSLKRRALAVGFSAVGMFIAMTATSRAQLIYSQNFDTDDSANWVVLQAPPLAPEANQT